MSEEKKCHFCNKEHYGKFMYDVRNSLSKDTRSKILVCRHHLYILYKTCYEEEKLNYLPVGQREYIAIKHLESQLNVSNTIQFK